MEWWIVSHMLQSRTDVRIRRGRVADAKALSEIFRESWRQSYRGIIPHLHLELMISRRGKEAWQTMLRSSENVLVLEVCGEIAGYATWGAARSRGHKQQGEIYELYLSPLYQGMGFGEHLFEACRHQIDERKLKGLVVWALLENTPAIDFYWRRGGRPVARTFDRLGGARLEKIAFTWA